jgi:hypothetical protein
MIKNNILFAGLIAASIFSSGSLKAQCAPVSEFSENFDALFCCDFGVVPPCWNSYYTNDGGNQIISNTSPASSPRNVYQIGYNKVSIVIMPTLTNINAGTHHFKFKARVSPGSTPGFLEFGYMTDAANPASFVVLQPITIANGTYDNTSERIFEVPTTVPANARLAIRNPGTTWVGHYWDDAVWEPKTALSTNDSKLNDFKIYPNPFTDFITLSETKEVQQLKITDVSGRLIKTIEKPSSKINLSELKAGIYFMTIDFKDGKSQTIKTIKE